MGLHVHQPKSLAGNKKPQHFVERCFDPGSPYNESLKETMIQMLGEVQERACS